MPTSQELSFRRLLTYVWKHSSFYKDYYSSHGIRETDLAAVTVQDLPFLTKKTLMENFDQAVTDPRLRRQELERWAHENTDPQQNFSNEFIVIRSSGTSGYQGTIVYDTKTWRTTDVAIAGRLPAPENYPGRTRVAWHINGRRAATLAGAVRMPKSLYETLIVSLLEDSELIVRRLNEFQPHRLVGYSSCVSILADLALRGNLQIQPRRIFVSGDLLSDIMKEKIQAAWRAPVFEFYAASESLCIALKDPGKEEIGVVDELNIVEVLNDDHRAVLPGEPGRLILTNLCNYVLPVLRYELGDYVVLGRSHQDFCPMAATLRNIKGRSNDALPVVLGDGRQDTIHPLVLPIYMPGLEKIQFISRQPDQIQIDYVGREDLDEALRREFQQILDMKGATRTSFSVRKVPQIANDLQTGKFRLIKVEGARKEGFSQGASLTKMPDAVSTNCKGPVNPFISFERGGVEQSIQARFERVVVSNPRRLAIKASDCLMTYEQLNRIANQIAQSILKRLGSRSEPIAVHLEVDAPLIAAILGVLKAGKFYVYLDPSYPVSRIAAIAEDAQPSLIITDNKGRQRLKDSSASSIPSLDLDELDSSLPSENPAIATSPDTLAWLLYTSGSTGRPKGVLHDHRNLLHNIMTYTNSMHICIDDRLSLLHSCNVITSVKNLLGALLNGASVYPFDVREEGLQHLIAWMIRERITVYHSVPSLFRHLCDALTGAEKFPDLRLIALGSEAVTKLDVEHYKRHFSSDCILVNLLGNTEMGTYREYFIDRTSPITSSIVPAGYAVEGKEVRLIHKGGNEVSPGDVGEIAVKSRYLAVGYWRDPAATQASFIADPKGGDERTYLTGDLGRMAMDGCLTYLGRKDFQVKIRGHRVDLAEIEMALLDLPGVKDAVVVAHDDPDHEKRLVGYIVQDRPGQSPADGLRNFLTSRFPDYMVPAAFVVLDRLPLSPDGKIERGALPIPAWNESKLRTNFVLPRTNLEKTVAGVWQEVLQLEEVGINDNFFDLGGHSLLILAVHEKLRGLAIKDLSVVDMLSYPTISSLAEFLTRGEIAQSSVDGLVRAASRRAHVTRQRQFRKEYRAKARPVQSKDE